MIDELLQILSQVHPKETELNKRPIPGIEADFGTRYSTGVDCDFVFEEKILLGNL